MGVEHAASPKPRKVAPSTVEYYRPDGARVIRLHQTDILVMHFANGDPLHPGGPYNSLATYSLIHINCGGWETQTTRARLNKFLPGFRVVSHRKVLYIKSTGAGWLDAQPILGGAITIRNGQLPPHDHYLRKVANNSAIVRFCNHCERIGWRQEFDGTVSNLGSSAVRQILLEGGYRWQDYSNPAIVGGLIQAAQLPLHKLVALRLGSPNHRAALRKAMRTYLLTLLGEPQP